MHEEISESGSERERSTEDAVIGNVHVCVMLANGAYVMQSKCDDKVALYFQFYFSHFFLCIKLATHTNQLCVHCVVQLSIVHS